MTPELVNHGHCKVCSRAVRFGQDTCSDQCSKEWADHTKKRARTALMFYVAGAVLIVVLLTQLLGQR